MMWGQTTAGVIAGLPLAFMSAAVLATLIPVDLDTKLAIAAALALPLWCATICAAFATPSGRRAWAGMLIANLVTGGVLVGFTLLGWYGVPEGLG